MATKGKLYKDVHKKKCYYTHIPNMYDLFFCPFVLNDFTKVSKNLIFFTNVNKTNIIVNLSFHNFYNYLI